MKTCEKKDGRRKFGIFSEEKGEVPFFLSFPFFFFFFFFNDSTNESFRLDRSCPASTRFSHPRMRSRRDPLRIHKYFLRLKSFRHEIWVRDTAQPFYQF